MNGKLRLLALPDDESLGFGGTFAKHAAENIERYLVTATRGDIAAAVQRTFAGAKRGSGSNIAASGWWQRHL